MPRLTFALLLIAPLATAPAAAEPYDLFGRMLQIELPAGHCMFDYNQPVEAGMIDYILLVNEGSNELISYFAPCDDLAAFRDGSLAYLPVVGTMMAPLTGGSFQPSTFDRASFLAAMAAQLPAVGDAELAQIEKEINESSGGTAVGQTQLLGLLAQDASALYVGLVADITRDDGTTLPMVTLVAITQLADVPLSANLTREYTSNDDIALLLAELQPYLATLTALNP